MVMFISVSIGKNSMLFPLGQTTNLINLIIFPKTQNELAFKTGVSSFISNFAGIWGEGSDYNSIFGLLALKSAI